MSILEMSFYGSVMILSALLFRRLFLNRLPKRTFTALWTVAAIRLILPFPLYSSFSLYRLTGMFNAASQSSVGSFAYVNISQVGAYGYMQGEPVCETAGAQAYTAPSPHRVWLYVWLLGTAAAALTFLLIYIGSRREFAMALPVEDEKINALLKSFKIRRKLRLKHSDRISSPLAYGIFRPVILLPSSYLTNSEEKELNFILTHEFVHICRFDAVKKLLCVTALCLHWFNPLVWLMFIIFNRDMELACDEGVLRQLGTEFKTDYAAVLIRAEARKSGLSSLFSTFAFKKGTAAEERIKAIMKTKTHTILSAAVSAILVCGSATVFASSPAENSDIPATAMYCIEEDAVGETEGKFTVTDKNFKEDYEKYKPFGLECDENGALYYNGKRVRFFADSTEIEEGSVITNMTYMDEKGEIDIHTVYEKTPNGDGSTNPFGKLVGIEEYKPGEVNFPAILSHEMVSEGEVSIAIIGEGEFTIIEGKAIAYAEGNGSQGGMTLAERFAQYKDYGVTYDESANNLYYNGELVRAFFDLSETSIFTFESADQGENIVLKTVYDDKGNLCGVEEVTDTELSFDLVETFSYDDKETVNA